MNDQLFKQLLSEKENVKLTDDFDTHMMLMVSKHASAKSKEKKYLLFMYLFFVLGLGFGFIITLSYIDTEFTLGNKTISIDRLILLIPLIIVLLLIFEKIYKATLVKLGKEEFNSL